MISALMTPFNKNSIGIFSEMFERVIIYGSIGNAYVYYEIQVILLEGILN